MMIYYYLEEQQLKN